MIPNPWDVGSARYLQHLGFPALATTSAGFAFSQGLPDSGDDAVMSRDRSLGYISSITAAVDLPVSADFMSGYGRQPEDVAESVTRCVATGVAGLSIEDATGESASPLYELSIAVERVRAARQAIDQSGEDVLLTARAECYHVGHPDPFRESVRRLQAYAAAGADVLFAPGPQTPARDQGARRGGCPEAAQPSRGPGHWSGRGGDRGARRATHQRRRRAGIGGVDRLHARRTSAEVEGKLRRTGEPGAVCRDQRPLCDGSPVSGLWRVFGWGKLDEPGPQTESSIADEWGRSESLDPDNVGDIADEGAGHRG